MSEVSQPNEQLIKDIEAALYVSENNPQIHHKWLRALLEENKQLTEDNKRLISPNVESLKYEKGKVDMRLSGVHALNMLEAFVDLFETNGGKNFLTTTMEAPARNKRYEITITNLNGELSAGEKMNQLVAELEQVKAERDDYRRVLQFSSSLDARSILSQYKGDTHE